MASSNPSVHPSVDSSVGQNLEVVRIIEHHRAPHIWEHYDLCEMSDGSKKARCKHCRKFFAHDGNSSLNTHTKKSCKALRQQVDPSQANITPQGGVFIYDNESLRQSFAELVIQKALSFDHFDDEQS